MKSVHRIRDQVMEKENRLCLDAPISTEVLKSYHATIRVTLEGDRGTSVSEASAFSLCIIYFLQHFSIFYTISVTIISIYEKLFTLMI